MRRYIVCQNYLSQKSDVNKKKRIKKKSDAASGRNIENSCPAKQERFLNIFTIQYHSLQNHYLAMDVFRIF